MRSLNQKQNLKLWEENAIKYSGHFVSWWDTNMKHIEINTISPWLKSNDYVLDVGCSNGASTVELQTITKANFFGIDYSPLAIAKTKILENKHLTFKYGDITTFSLPNTFDKAISIRCLINIMDRKKQLKALKNIHTSLKPKGLYIMCEGFKQGYRNLNNVRRLFQLPPLPIPKYNLYFEEKNMNNMLSGLFKIEKVIKHASLYYLGTRVLQYLAIDDTEPRKNSEWNNFFYKSGHETNKSGDFSANKVYILKRID